MRITNTSMMRSQLYDTQQNLSRMNKINEQLNTGKVVNRVSDDPHKAIRIMNLNNEIKYTEKYNYNIDETVGWLDNTDSSLENLGNIFSDLKQDILKVGNGAYGEDEYKAIQAELNEKLKDVASALNTTYAGKYMFGGTNVDEPPMIAEEKDGVVTLKINPNSNTENLKADISDVIILVYNLSVGEIFTGVDATGKKIDYVQELNNLSSLMNDIVNGTDAEKATAKETLLGDAHKSLDNLANHTLNERTSFGVRSSTAEKVKELNDDNILSMKGVLSLDQDVDVVEKFMELKSSEMVYQASLQVGAKLIKPTILDYL